MKQLLIYLLFFGILLSPETPLHAQDAEKLFQQGLIKEEGEGNLTEAIEIYDQLANDTSVDRTLRANALMHIGICYEKLGKKNAQDAYQRIITEYPDQIQLTAIARRKLELLKVPTISTVGKENGLSIINLYKKDSWMENSSLSSDGIKLAGIDFSIGQNVKVYDRITGESQMLTEYKWTTEPYGITYNPTWSPDGKEIVYLFTNTPGIFELQTSTLQGKKRTLIKNEHNAGRIYPRQWSKDGSKILTFKQDSTSYYTIGLVPAKGGTFKALHKTKWKKRFVEGDASLSPDGKYVVFSDGSEDKMDLFIVDADGRNKPTVLSSHPSNESEPLWSPNGKHIVFIRKTKGGSFLFGIKMEEGKPVGNPFMIKEGMQNVDLVNWTEHGITYDYVLDIRDIYTLALDPETGKPIEKPKPLDFSLTGSNISPVWSYNGKQLAFISYNDYPKVVILNTESGKHQDYSIPINDLFAAALHDLHWLPDNSGLGFTHQNRKLKTYMYRLDLATGNWENWPLLERGWTRADWGPDSNSFIYNKPNDAFYQYNIKTGESKEIFKPDNSKEWYVTRGLRFSRDHKKLTFMFQNSSKIKNLMVYDLESGKSKTLSQDYWKPTFSPDGNKILAFGKKQTAAIISLEGENLHQFDLAKHFTPETRIHYPDWSPDGKQLIFPIAYWKTDTYLIKNILK
ncbi:MAG: tetratricopeptide repeat protein [Bacteroidota bacterium]